MLAAIKRWMFNVLAFLPVSAFSAQPAFYLEHQIGDQNPWFAQILYPLFHEGKNHPYIDVQGAYSFTNTNYNLQAGFLDRYLSQPRRAYGGYLYTAYNRSPFGQFFTTLNPGLELLTPAWHINLNGYVPVSPTRQNSGSSKFANDFGISNYTYFQGHNEYDQILQPSSVTGAGGDLIASLRVKKLKNIALSVGSYYFHIPEAPINIKSNILGATAGITTPNIYNFSLKLAYNYDELFHNTVTLGIRFHLDGNDKNQKAHWLNQPVQHNIATLGQANSIPIVNGLVAIGSPSLVRDNIWFFTPGGGSFLIEPTINLADCTYEHPCANLSNSTTQSIAEINKQGQFRDNPSLYLAPGNYTFPGKILTLFGNESLIGRSQNYLKPAMGDERPLLTTDELIIQGVDGNQYNTVANLQLKNAGGHAPSAIFVTDTKNTLLDNLNIGITDPNNETNNYIQGLLLVNSESITLSNSSVHANNFSPSSNLAAIGLFVDKIKNLSIINSQIDLISTNLPLSLGIAVFNNGSTIHLNDSAINITKELQGGSLPGANFAYEIFTQAGVSADFYIENSTLSTSVKGGDFHAGNIFLGANSRAFIINSTINAYVTSSGNNEGAINFDLHEASEVTVQNSTLNAQGVSTTGIGFATNASLSDQAKVHFFGSTLTTTGQSGAVSGNTNITALDQSSADINQSTLITSFAGAAAGSGVEPSGAVSIWTLDNSSITIRDSIIKAISNNDATLAATLQSQDSSKIEVSNSQLFLSQTNGNTEPLIHSQSIIAGNNSSISINDSLIYAELAGTSPNDFDMLTVFDSARININHSAILAFNHFTSPTGQQETIGAEASDNGIIYILDSTLILVGEHPVESKTTGNGKVIIAP